MVHPCVAKNCRTGYGGKKTPGVSLLRFPHNEQLIKQWLKNVNRPDFVPSTHSRVCSLHFKEEDFQTESQDKTNRRKRKREGLKLKQRRLKPDAIPITDDPKKSLTRLHSQKRKAARLSDTSQDADKLKSLEDLEERLRSGGLLEGFTLFKKGSDLFINYMEVDDLKIPFFAASIAVDSDLNVSVSSNGKSVSSCLPKGFGSQLVNFTEVTTLMTDLKELVADGQEEEIDWLNCVCCH